MTVWIFYRMVQTATPVCSEKEKKTNNITFRSIGFTSYVNPDGWDVLPTGISFICWGDEVCPITQRSFKKGFAHSSNPLRFSGWNKIFPDMNIHKMSCSFRKDEAYCLKQSSYQKLGIEPMGSGHKRCLAELSRDVARNAVAVRAADTCVVAEDFDDDISDDGSSVHSYESECRFYTLRQKYKRSREETAGSQREIKLLQQKTTGFQLENQRLREEIASSQQEIKQLRQENDELKRPLLDP